nr:cleavage and polyadenylation specificity factor subunit 1-like [Pocillopora verrucosa]
MAAEGLAKGIDYRCIIQQESASSDKTGDGTTKRRKLELVSQYSLFGNIECLKAVRSAGNSRDSLLLSFKGAKSCNQEYFWPPLVCGS